MRLDDIDPTDNASDRGGFGGGSGGGGGLFGLLFFLPMIFGRKVGCLMMVVILGAMVVFGFMGGGVDTGSTPPGQVAQTGGTSGNGVCNTTERLESCRVMTLADKTWDQIFKQAGETYSSARINFFTNNVQSGCGSASSAVGPFYCPADDGVYLDTAFFQELSQQFGASGDLARIYVIAHEMGHHIQDLLGVSDEISQQQAQSSEAGANQLSVKLELQADCYAGVFFGRNKDRLEGGDIEEAMKAANAIGDDTLQKGAQGEVHPESFTHGTSAQRMAWLRKGLDSGDPGACAFE